MQFKIPQNVQREDVIFANVTIKQLIVLVIGGTSTYGLFTVLNASTIPFEVWIGPVAFIGLLTLAIAFLKFRDMTFTEAFLFYIEYKFKPQKRLWRQGAVPTEVYAQEAAKKEEEDEQELSDREKRKKMLELSKQLDSFTK